MASFIIEGGHRLKGEITPQGAKNEVLQMLSKVENPNYYRLLHSRYILYKKWEQIAYEMNYTYRGITKMHGKALLAFESVLESACCS